MFACNCLKSEVAKLRHLGHFVTGLICANKIEPKCGNIYLLFLN